jgi:hypothetical protein
MGVTVAGTAPGGPAPAARRYFRLPETLVKVVDNWVPTAVIAVMMTTAMSAAIRPYSIAVAPDSSEMKDLRTRRIVPSSLNVPLRTDKSLRGILYFSFEKTFGIFRKCRIFRRWEIGRHAPQPPSLAGASQDKSHRGQSVTWPQYGPGGFAASPPLK